MGDDRALGQHESTVFLEQRPVPGWQVIARKPVGDLCTSQDFVVDFVDQARFQRTAEHIAVGSTGID